MNFNTLRICSPESTNLILVSTITISIVLVTCSYLFFKRSWVYFQLSSGKCNLPTVVWMPRFFNYDSRLDEHCKLHKKCWSDKISLWYYKKSREPRRKKMGPSTITSVLPRMERLNGPYGMYATLYGLSTKVVHVAHPVPARLILMGDIGSRKSAAISKDSYGASAIRSRNRINYSFPSGASKSPAYDHFKNFSGDGVFTSDGLTWKKKRASVLHCLLKGCTRDGSPESIRLELEANRAADNFVMKSFEISCCGESGKSGGTDLQKNRAVNIVPLLQKSTIGLIYSLITHHNVNFHLDDLQESKKKIEYDTDDISTSSETDESSDESIKSNLSTIFANDGQKSKNTEDCNNSLSLTELFRLLPRYLDAVTNIRMIILAQSRSVWFLLPRWMYRTFSPMYREEERIMATIRDFACLACKNARTSSPLHSLRFRASHNCTLAENVKNGSVVNKNMLDEAITLLFAGQDTTAATLSWTLHLLSLYPQVQNRLSEEINHVVENASNESNKIPSEFITRKMIAKMPYLDAVLKESMRLYPVAPFIVRKISDVVSIPAECACDTSATSTPSVVIPKGTFACIWIYGMHRNKKLWRRPDDFLPERWINPTLKKHDPAQSDKKLHGAFIPFALGPRNCLGQPLAHIILRIMLAKIMKNCKVLDRRVNPSPNLQYGNGEGNEEILQQTTRKDMQAGFTVLPHGGVRLHLIKQETNVEYVKG